MTHPTHKTRISDSSLYDEVCTLCGATDGNPEGRKWLELPCSNSPTPSPDDLVEEVARAMKETFKNRVAAAAEKAFEETGDQMPRDEIWTDYAKAAIAAYEARRK